MVLATMSWGLSTVVNKLTLDQTAMRPMSQQSMQLTASVAVLIVVVTIRGKRPSTSAWRLGRSGLLEPGASYVLGLIGLAMTAASHASIIGALEPTFVAVGAWMFLHQRLSGRAAALMSITLIGALLVVTSSLGIGSTATVDGDVLLVVSVVCAATYVLLCSRSVGVVEPIIATLTQQVWALAIVLPALAVSVVTGGFGPLPHGSGWGLVVISGLLSYVIPFALYLTALESLPASSTAQYLALIPLFGMLGAATILGETITARSLVGGAVVIVALVLLARLSGREPPGPVASPPVTRCRRP
jgi:drug/metabolite transporter (DMT)-like permease